MSSVIYKQKKPKIDVEYEIMESYLENDTKKELLMLNRLDLIDKDTFPNLVIVSPPNSGEDKATEIYRHIIQEKGILGKECDYLKLIFPGPDHGEEHFDKFFCSPRISAVTSNNFSGVFVVSLEEWKCEKLIEEKCFERLMDYIQTNRKMRFAFLCHQEDKGVDLLIEILKKHLNIVDIHIGKLSLGDSYLYVYKKLQDKGLSICKKGKSYIYLKNIILVPNISREGFLGYRDLDRIIEIILFEAAIYKTSVAPITEENELEFLKTIKEELLLKDNEEDSKVKIGFRI